MEVINVSIPEAARLLGVGRTTVYRYIAEGKLRKVKLYRRSVITLGSVRNLAQEAARDA
jgi:excisionase family DNA binding protein